MIDKRFDDNNEPLVTEPVNTTKDLHSNTINQNASDLPTNYSHVRDTNQLRDQPKYEVSTGVIRPAVCKFAGVLGLMMFAIGALAFVFPGSVYDLPILNLNTSYGMAFGLIPMNIINKIVVGGMGLLGLIAAKSIPASITWAKTLAWVTLGATVLGLIPTTDTFFGYWPLFGANVAVYAVHAVLGFYFGYSKSVRRVNKY